MIDLISYDIRKDVQNDLCIISLKYTDGKTDIVKASTDLFKLLGKDESLELFKSYHVVNKD